MAAAWFLGLELKGKSESESDKKIQQLNAQSMKQSELVEWPQVKKCLKMETIEL